MSREEDFWFKEYIKQDFLPGDSLVPRDVLNPTTLRDLAHWRNILVFQSHLDDRSQQGRIWSVHSTQRRDMFLIKF